MYPQNTINYFIFQKYLKEISFYPIYVQFAYFSYELTKRINGMIASLSLSSPNVVNKNICQKAHTHKLVLVSSLLSVCLDGSRAFFFILF